MTYREWAEKNIPDWVGPIFIGGVSGCPKIYGFEYMRCGHDPNDVDCQECWNREMNPQDAKRCNERRTRNVRAYYD